MKSTFDPAAHTEPRPAPTQEPYQPAAVAPQATDAPVVPSAPQEVAGEAPTPTADPAPMFEGTNRGEYAP